MNPDRLTKQIFMHDKQTGCNTWTSEIRIIFNILDKSDHFEGNLFCDLNYTKNVFETLTESEWPLSVDAKLKLLTYK